MSVLLFGASGYLGTHLARALAARGCEVTSVVRKPAAVAAPGRVVEYPLGRGAPAPEVAPQRAAVFLSQSHRYADWPEGAVDTVSVNLAGLVEALELARRAGAKHFLHASSGAVYAPSDGILDEDTPLEGAGLYALTKRMGEEIARQWSPWMRVVSVRIFALYGPGQTGKMVPNVIEKVRAGAPVTLQPRRVGEREPEGFATSPCHVDDAVEAICALLEGSFAGVLNLAGPERVSIRRLAEEAGRLLGREPVFEVAERPRAGDLVASVSRLRAVTGGPRIGLERGLASILADHAG